MESYTLTIPEISIGDLKIFNPDIAVLDLSMINLAYERLEIGKIIGVIGGDILMQYGAVIDYSTEKLSFRSLKAD